MQRSPDGKWEWTGARWRLVHASDWRYQRVHFNHGLHLFLSLITLGAWLPFYFLAWAGHRRVRRVDMRPKYWFGDGGRPHADGTRDGR